MNALTIQHPIADRHSSLVRMASRSDDSFTIRFSDEKNLLTIKGCSIGKEALSNYELLLTKLEWLTRNREIIHVSFDLTTFDLPSIRYLFLIIKKLNNFHCEGKDVNVLWNAEAENCEMIEMGIDFCSFCVFPFQFHLK